MFKNPKKGHSRKGQRGGERKEQTGQQESLMEQKTKLSFQRRRGGGRE